MPRLSDNPGILALLKKQYKDLKRHALRAGDKPPSFAQYCEWVETQVVTQLSHDMAAKVPKSDYGRTYYMARRLKDLKGGPHVESVLMPCIQCHDFCAIDVTMVEFAKASVGVICDHCASEQSGKSSGEIISNQLNNFFDHA